MTLIETEGQTPATTGESKPSPVTAPFFGWRDDLDRLFDNFLLSPFGRRLLDLEPFRRRGWSTTDITPRMDVVETDEAFEVTAELPGMTEKDIDVSVADGAVTIRGEKKTEREEKKGDVHLSERSFGTFTRSFGMPENINEDGISAQFDNGVLTLTLPKTEKSKPRAKKIEVKGKS